MNELVVVACHGPQWIGQCRASLVEHTDTPTLFVDTSGTIEHGADVAVQGGWSTGTYLWAYELYAAYDRFLFIQDSMTALADPLPWFRNQWRGEGASCWALFPMQWDNGEQARRVSERYPTVSPPNGIFGPVFYTDRGSLDALAARRLLPDRPTSRLDAQETERSWAFAFATAGMPAVGPAWDVGAMQSEHGLGPFRKTWAARP